MTLKSLNTVAYITFIVFLALRSSSQSFSYPNPLCKNGSPNQLPTTSGQPGGGFYTFAPTGLVLNTSTGLINIAASAPSTYTLTYSINSNTALVIIPPQGFPSITPTGISGCHGDVRTMTCSLPPLGAAGYTWSTGATTNPLTFSLNTAVTTYSVLIRDSYGCTYSATRNVMVSPRPANLNVNSPSLCGNNGPVQIAVTGSVAPNTFYVWQPGGFTGPVNNVNPPQSQTYTINVNTGTCTLVLYSNVTVSPAITPTVSFNYPFPICADSGDPFPIKDTGFAEGGTFFSDLENFPLNPVTGKINLGTLAAGEYVVSYSLASNQATCREAGFYTASIQLGQVSFMTVSPDLELVEGTGAIISANNGEAYTWTPEVGLNCSDCPSPFAAPVQTTRYCVSDPTNGCAHGACVNVNIVCLNGGDMSVPNAFTPNKDNKNEKFCLQGWSYCVTDFVIRIFNRWGQQVYTSTDSAFCWDGTDNGAELPAGVYAYSISANVNREKIVKSGNITLIR